MWHRARQSELGLAISARRPVIGERILVFGAGAIGGQAARIWPRATAMSSWLILGSRASRPLGAMVYRCGDGTSSSRSPSGRCTPMNSILQ